MKSKATQKESKCSTKFPKLMICNGYVVLFTEDKCGMIIYMHDEECSRGHYLGEYSENLEMVDFEDFHGKVVIKS